MSTLVCLGGLDMIKSRMVWISCLLGTFVFMFFSNERLALVLFVTVVALPTVFIVINQFAARNVILKVEMPQVSEKNQQFTGQLRVENKKKYYLSLVVCKLNCKNEVTGENIIGELLFHLGGNKDECFFPFVLESKFCGCVITSIRFLKVYDVFGLFGVKPKVPATSETIVLPNTFAPQLVLEAYMAKDVEADEYSQIKAGCDPSETFAIREYRPGDSLGRIHWKLTGKFDEILIREAGLPVRHSFLILLDTSIPSAIGQQAKVNDALLEIIMSLCQKMSEEEITYEIGWQDYNSKSFFHCRVSNLDEVSGVMNKLMHTCYKIDDSDAFSYFADNYGETSFEHIVYISRFFPAKCMQFLGDSHMTAIICTCDANVAVTSETNSLNLYFCTPENYERELFALAI